MSKRLLSNEPNTPKSLKELFWENAEKARMGEFWKDKKSYKELSEATRIPSGSLRMLFMNKPKGNIPKIVAITTCGTIFARSWKSRKIWLRGKSENA